MLGVGKRPFGCSALLIRSPMALSPEAPRQVTLVPKMPEASAWWEDSEVQATT